MALDAKQQAAIVVTSVLAMTATRLRSIDNFKPVSFAGNDAYYHYRQISYTVQNWPKTMPFDPWTNYPHGTSQGQFGTLYDQIVATAVLLVGQEHLYLVTLVAPVIFGSLTVIPLYFMSRKLRDPLAGIFAIMLLLFMPGSFFIRTSVGFSDHHAAEIFFHTATVAAIVYALAATTKAPDITEVTSWLDYSDVICYSIVASMLFVSYLLVWPPGIVLAVILGVFLIIASIITNHRGGELEPLTIFGVAFSMPALFIVLLVSNRSMQSTTIGLVHVGVLAGILLASMLFTKAQRRSRRNYPFVIGMIGVFTVFWFALTGHLSFIIDNVMKVFLFGPSITTQTIVEARTLGLIEAPGFLFDQYGLVIVVAAVSLTIVRSSRYETLFVSIWFIMVAMMAFTQIRFNYYLAVPVVVMASYGLSVKLEQKSGWLLIAVSIVLISSLAIGGSVSTIEMQPSDPEWIDSMEWLRTNSPDPGFEYYGTYSEESFEYPSSAYGVMSWWDYGHVITVLGERPAVANPFQQQAYTSAVFFLNNGSAAGVKYVVVDDEMATDKFPAIVTWTNDSPESYYDEFNVNDKYNRTLLSRLYFNEADGYDLVYESDETTTIGTVVHDGQPVLVNRRISPELARAVEQRDDLELQHIRREPTIKIFLVH